MRSHFSFFAYTLTLILMAGLSQTSICMAQSAVRVNFKDDQAAQEKTANNASSHSTHPTHTTPTHTTYSEQHHGCGCNATAGSIQGGGACDNNCDRRLFQRRGLFAGGGLTGACGCDGGMATGGCADGGMSAGCGVDSGRSLRSRLLGEDSIPRGPAVGVNRVTRGTYCHSGCNGCDDCRGGLFSGVGQSGGLLNRGQGCGSCSSSGIGTGVGFGSRLGSGTGTGTGTGAGSGSRLGSGIGTGTGCGSCSGSGIGTGAGFGSRLGSGSDTGAGFGSRLGSGSLGSGTDTGVGFGSRIASRFAGAGYRDEASGLGGRGGRGILGGGDCPDGSCGNVGRGGLLGRAGGWGAGDDGFAGRPGLLGHGHAGMGGHAGGCGPGCGHGCGCLSGIAAGIKGVAGPSRGQIPHTAQPDYGMNGMGGQAPTYAYPYYTTRAPRDFLQDNPPSIGW